MSKKSHKDKKKDRFERESKLKKVDVKKEKYRRSYNPDEDED